ncbi:MAG: hypothetical protein IPM24_02195 [Bryobacterales bacterium]|nr:hypothetical protein [Bryobacterales bacterium]
MNPLVTAAPCHIEQLTARFAAAGLAHSGYQLRDLGPDSSQQIGRREHLLKSVSKVTRENLNRGPPIETAGDFVGDEQAGRAFEIAGLPSLQPAGILALPCNRNGDVALEPGYHVIGGLPVDALAERRTPRGRRQLETFPDLDNPRYERRVSEPDSGWFDHAERSEPSALEFAEKAMLPGESKRILRRRDSSERQVQIGLTERKDGVRSA